MPKKKPGMTPEEQSRRFVDDVQSMIDAGELSHIAGEKGLDRTVKRQAKPKNPS